MIKEHTEECKCFQCGGEFIRNYDFDTGYGVNREGHRICFKCCGENDRKELENMKIGERTSLYLILDGDTVGGWGRAKVSNWPNSYVKHCNYKKGSHNLAGVRYDVWFTEGKNYFHGVRYGRDSEICYVTCVKPF